MSGVNLSRLSLIISLEIKSALVTGEESSYFSILISDLYSFKIALPAFTDILLSSSMSNLSVFFDFIVI